jgi:hypothetical protein
LTLCPKHAHATGLRSRSVISTSRPGAKERRGACKECYRAAQRASWARNPRVQARRREIVERWRDEGLNDF